MDIVESLQRNELLITVNCFLDEYYKSLNLSDKSEPSDKIPSTTEEILKLKLQQLKNKKILLEKEHVFLKKYCEVKDSIIDWLKDIVFSRLNNINKITRPLCENKNVPDNLKCPECLTNKCNAILNCTHVVCSECSMKLDFCTICDEQIFKIGVVYFRI